MALYFLNSACVSVWRGEIGVAGSLMDPDRLQVLTGSPLAPNHDSIYTFIVIVVVGAIAIVWCAHCDRLCSRRATSLKSHVEASSS